MSHASYAALLLAILPAIAVPATAVGMSLGASNPSPEARVMTDWIASSHDNHDAPFIIVDKLRARVLVFNKSGVLVGSSMALLGRGRGDVAPADIGSRSLSQISPRGRITEAGRFKAVFGRGLSQDVLWLDYNSGLAIHRVVQGKSGERRLQRLVSSSITNKRVSYGCVNVPANFYDQVIVPDMSPQGGVVYVLPEVKPLDAVFKLTGSADLATQRPPTKPLTAS